MKIIAKAIMVILVLQHSYRVFAVAVDESVLWLPKKYQSFMPQLVAAAKLADSGIFCEKILSGKMVENSQPIRFNIYCRNVDGRSAALIYQLNGKADNYQLEHISGGMKKFTPDERVAACQAAFEVKAKRIKDISTLGEFQNKNAQLTEYWLNFDAKSFDGIPLKYVAVCRLDHKEVESVEIKTRKLP